MKGALGWVEGGGAAGDGHAEARRGRRRRGGRWGEGGRKWRLCRVGAPAGWLGESCSGLQQSKGLGVSGSLTPATGWGDWVGAEFAHPVADDLVSALAEFLRLQASEGIVVEDAAGLLIREEDEVDVRGGVGAEVGMDGASQGHLNSEVGGT
jgi:hypothetical protein